MQSFSAVTVTAVATGAPVLLQVNLTPLRHRRRQSNDPFIGPGGTTNDCAAAISYSIINEQLFADGNLVSTNFFGLATGYAPLGLINPTGPIATSFSIINGYLAWSNAPFTNGAATFCITPNGILNAVFNPSKQSATCETVHLSAVPGMGSSP